MLHEEFSKTERSNQGKLEDESAFVRFVSTLLYRLCKNALADDELFEKIVVFREKMNRSKWTNYENHKKGFINIIPPQRSD